MPQVSAEVRWFLPSTETARIAAFTSWFDAGAVKPGGGNERPDVYVLEATADFGIKDRGGNPKKPGLEVKSFVGSAGQIHFAGAKATAQVWTKVASKKLALPAAQLLVKKWRSLRKFDCAVGAIEVELGAGESGEEPKSGRFPDSGCNVEWTRIEASGTAWWSFGIEAFAKRNDTTVLSRNLTQTAAALEVRTSTPPTLDASWIESSYPQWISDHFLVVT